MIKKLDVWLNPHPAQTLDAKFYPHNVAYSPANPDSTRQECGNCVHFAVPDGCHLHDADVQTATDMICGYHVYGDPNPTPTNSVSALVPLQPEYSGLITPPEPGASCDRCKYYRPAGQTAGLCMAICDPRQPDVPFPVDALARCARFASVDDA